MFKVQPRCVVELQRIQALVAVQQQCSAALEHKLVAALESKLVAPIVCITMLLSFITQRRQDLAVLWQFAPSSNLWNLTDKIMVYQSKKY